MGKDLEFDRVKADNTDGFGGNIRVLAQPLPRCPFEKRSCWKRSGTSAEDIFSSRKKVQAGRGRFIQKTNFPALFAILFFLKLELG